jgi:hypothetical protein
MRSKSEVVDTRRSVAHFLESIKNQPSALDLTFGMFGRGEHATWPGLRSAQGAPGGGVNLEELSDTCGGKRPVEDVVGGGDQTPADAGFAGAAGDVAEGRHGVGREHGECTEVISAR